MIIRSWRGLSEPGNADDYLAHMRTGVLPQLRTLDGFHGVEVLTREHDGRVEILVQTRWASMDAIRAFAGEDITSAVVEPHAQSLLADWDRTVRHYISHSF